MGEIDMEEVFKEAIFELIQYKDGGVTWSDIESEIESAISELREEDRIVFRSGEYVIPDN